MSPYELVLTLDPSLGEEKIEEIIGKTEEKIKSFGGEFEKVDKWGVRKLAATFKKAKKLTQGYFAVLFFSGEKTLPGSLQHFLKVNENIVRYSIVKAVPKPKEAEIAGTPVEKKEIEAVAVGEIKVAREGHGQS